MIRTFSTIACIIGLLLIPIYIWLSFQPTSLELQVGSWLRFSSPRWLSWAMMLLSDSIYLLFAINMSCLLLYLLKRFQLAALITATSIVSLLLIWPLKELISRPRPDNLAFLTEFSGYSFPSGHALASTVLAGCLVYCIFIIYPSRHFRLMAMALCGLYILLVGWSRIYLGAHYLSDVIAGYILGLTVLLLIAALGGFAKLKLAETANA